MKKLLLDAVMIAAMMGVVMSSCKKEESAQMKDGVAQTEQSMSRIEKEVLDFLDNYSEMKRGAKIEGAAVSIEEACRQLETAFNYNFGFTQSFLVNMQIDTVCVAMPKTDPEGNVAYGDMMDTYSDIVDAVREVYRGIDLENKTLQFVMMSHDDGLLKDDVDSIRIVLNTGSRTTDPQIPDPQPYPWYGIPFTEPECYLWSSTSIYGNNSGGFFNTNYADVQLQIKIANYDSGKAIATEQNPTFIVNPYRYETFQGGQYLDEWLFYACGLTEEEVYSYYLCWDYLNQEYSDIMLNTHSISMEIRPYEHDGYYGTRVYGKIQCIDPNATPKLYCISHVVEIYHATICKRVNTEYPILID